MKNKNILILIAVMLCSYSVWAINLEELSRKAKLWEESIGNSVIRLTNISYDPVKSDQDLEKQVALKVQTSLIHDIKNGNRVRLNTDDKQILTFDGEHE